ncbi:MAG: Fe-S cluster assembly protein NifU [Thermodesulfobacteriota bacterium]
MWEYTDKVREHFLNPRNVGDMPDADAVGEVGSLACGDALKLYLKVDADGRIVDARFQTFGCASAIASSSVLTELIKGKTVDEALKIGNKDIAAALGGLPREKMHCSVMGREALEAAVKNLRGEAPPQAHPEGEVVCRCFGVTDEQIRRAVRENGLTTVAEVTDYTKAGGGCEECHDRIAELIAEARGEAAPAAPAPEAPRPLTNLQRMQRVMQVLDEEIRPSLRKDGGDIELIDIEGRKVLVALRRACAGCPSSQITLTDFVERKLQELVEPDITVQEVRP